VHLFETFDCFHFYDNGIFNDHIHAVATIETVTSVDEGQGFLAFDVQTFVSQLEQRAFLIRGFERARPKFAMDA
jgi:hypothetical protein